MAEACGNVKLEGIKTNMSLEVVISEAIQPDNAKPTTGSRF